MAYKIVPANGADKWKNPSSSLYKLNQHFIFAGDNPYGFPDILPTDTIPESFISYHDPEYRKFLKKNARRFVDFFLDDYYFESAWSRPHTVLANVQDHYAGALGTTFSIFDLQPRAMNIWNIYRNRWMCAYLQFHGVTVVPVVQWASEDTFEYCFTSLPKKSVLAVSTLGSYKLADRALFQPGFEEMLKQLEPAHLLVYGEFFPINFEEYNIPLNYYPTFWAQKRVNIP